MNLSPELLQRIDHHIHQVEQHLAGLAADEQQEILQTVRTHIHDALEHRSNGNPSKNILEAILAEMDPPESYGSALQNTAAEARPKQKQRHALPLFIALSLIMIGICIFLIKSTTTAHATQRGPAPVIGTWESIDFVSEIDHFEPGTRTFQNALYLKGLTLNPDGTTHKSGWTWTNNLLIQDGDKTAGKFTIQNISDTNYLFLEWISGDVTIRKQKPKYYVMKRAQPLNPPKLETIQEGAGCGPFKTGASRKQLIAQLGHPDPNSTDTWLRWQRHHINALVDNERGAIELRFNPGFAGSTSKGIRIGSSAADLQAAYGEPNHITDKDGRKKLIWPQLGILTWLSTENTVTQIVIFKPHSPKAQPAT